MTMNDFLRHCHGPLYMGIVTAERLKLQGHTCWLLKVSDCGLECPNTEIVMLERGPGSLGTERGYWHITFQDQIWWAYVVHMGNIYDLKEKSVIASLIMAVFQLELGVPHCYDEKHLVHAISQHYFNKLNITAEQSIEISGITYGHPPQ